MRRSTAALIAASLVLAASPAASASQTSGEFIVEAHETDFTGLTVIEFDGEADRPGAMAQSVTFEYTRTVSGFEFYSAHPFASVSITKDVIVEVWEGHPDTGTLIHSHLADDVQFVSHGDLMMGTSASPTRAESWTRFDLPDIQVEGGMTYTFGLRAVPTTSPGVVLSFATTQASVDDVPGGYLWHDLNGVTGWQADTAWDLLFRLYGQGIVPPDPIDWETMQPVAPPAQTLLDMDQFDGPEQTGWSFASAATALIGFHRGTAPSQCDFIKETPQAGCPSGTASPGEVGAGLYAYDLYDVAAHHTAIADFSTLKAEIDAGRPVMVRLEQVALDSVAQPDIYGLVRGYDTSGIDPQVDVSFAFDADTVPSRTVSLGYDDLVTQTGLTLTLDGLPSTLTWTWSGIVQGAWGDLDPSAITSDSVWDDATVAQSTEADPRGLFLITLIALDKWGVTFECDPDKIDLDRAVGNEDLHSVLKSFWTANALTAGITQLNGLSVSTTQAPVAMDIADEVTSFLLGALANTVSSGGNPFNSDPGIGYAATQVRALWATSHLTGVCNY